MVEFQPMPALPARTQIQGQSTAVSTAVPARTALEGSAVLESSAAAVLDSTCMQLEPVADAT